MKLSAELFSSENYKLPLKSHEENVVPVTDHLIGQFHAITETRLNGASHAGIDFQQSHVVNPVGGDSFPVPATSGPYIRAFR